MMHHDFACLRRATLTGFKRVHAAIWNALQGIFKRLGGQFHAANFLVVSQNAEIPFRHDKRQNVSRALQIWTGFGQA